MNTILLISITIWLTMSVITTIKELADRNERTIPKAFFIFILAPVIVISEIVHYWEEENRRWKEFYKKYPKK